MSEGKSNGPILTYVLGIALAILFAAVGLVVQDIRGNIADNQRVVIELQHQMIKLSAELHEETRLTEKIREWYIARMNEAEKEIQRLKNMPVVPPSP